MRGLVHRVVVTNRLQASTVTDTCHQLARETRGQVFLFACISYEELTMRCDKGASYEERFVPFEHERFDKISYPVRYEKRRKEIRE